MLEMIFVDSVSYDGLPVGSHKAVFKGIEPTQTQNGKAWRWRFEDARRQEGQRACQTVKACLRRRTRPAGS